MPEEATTRPHGAVKGMMIQYHSSLRNNERMRNTPRHDDIEVMPYKVEQTIERDDEKIVKRVEAIEIQRR